MHSMSNNEWTRDELTASIDAMAALLVKALDKDYSFIKDENGEISGFWLKDPDFWLFDADQRDIKKRLTRLRTIAIKHDLSEDVFEKILYKKYRIVPNTYETKSGIYLMLGRALAPGEKKAWWKLW